MNNFWQRAITGAVYVAVIILSVVFDARIFFLLFAVVTPLALAEFYRHTIVDNAPLRYIGVMLGLTVYLAIGSVIFDLHIFADLLPVIFVLPYLLLVLGLFNTRTDHFKNVGTLLLGVFYIAIPFGFLPAFEQAEAPGSHFHPLLAIFILFWTNDTGAYLSGRAFGKTPLFPAVSPKKTVEGLVGGVLLTLVAAYLFTLTGSSIPLEKWLMVAAIVSVFGTLGDLVESQFKRLLGLKDSGNILPGHGGLLDRFDGFFIAIPFVYAYLFLL